MKSKIILTGECKCGKTTLMNKVLNSAVASNKLTLTDVYGYKTIPVIENNDLTAFDIETFHGVRARIASINKISEFKFKRFYVNINSFNYVIQAELEAGIKNNAKLIVMDEIGLMEKFSPDYIKFILNLFNYDIPIFGVLKLIEGDEFLDAIKFHKNVDLCEINLMNRDWIYEKIYNKVENLL